MAKIRVSRSTVASVKSVVLERKRTRLLCFHQVGILSAFVIPTRKRRLLKPQQLLKAAMGVAKTKLVTFCITCRHSWPVLKIMFQRTEELPAEQLRRHRISFFSVSYTWCF